MNLNFFFWISIFFELKKSPDDLDEIRKIKSLDISLNDDDADNFLSKFGENFEIMIENVSDVVSEPMWNPENNSTYDDFLTYKVPIRFIIP